MKDTHPEAERVLIKLLREAGAERRLSLALAITNHAVRAAQAGIERANTHLSPLERKLLFVEVSYGRGLAGRVREYLRRHGGDT